MRHARVTFLRHASELILLPLFIFNDIIYPLLGLPDLEDDKPKAGLEDLE